MTSEPLPPDSYRDPTGQKYWDGQTWQATIPPTTPAFRKPETRIKRFAKNAAVVLFALVGAEWGMWIQPFGTDPEGGTHPDEGTDSEDGHV
jgi:hypothetical protein